MNQIAKAREGKITPEMAEVARKENVTEEFIRHGVANGTIVIPANKNHKNLDPIGIGNGLLTKVNANIGTSTEYGDIDSELAKLKIAIDTGADTVMDLSTGGNVTTIRRAILKECSLPVGTVPIYQVAIKAIERYGSIIEMSDKEIFDVIEEHAADGIDFITVHCGVTISAVEKIRKHGRTTGIVSRGGAFMAGWMIHNDRENPLYEHYDRLLSIVKKYDVTLSLGDGMRPGSLADATDQAQIEELTILGSLVTRAREAGIQVMVEGPGHLPLNHIETNVKLEKSICSGAPFYVLGPLVTDIAAGYDHITAAIGGAIAAAAGTDFLCYVTPTEHLGLPDVEDVKLGVIASRIAAHSGDIAKGIKGVDQQDRKMATARMNLDWEAQLKLALDPMKAKELRQKHLSYSHTCSMCGQYCAMEVAKRYLGISTEKC